MIWRNEDRLRMARWAAVLTVAALLWTSRPASAQDASNPGGPPAPKSEEPRDPAAKPAQSTPSEVEAKVGATDLDVGFDVVPLRVVVEDTGTDENGRPRLSVRYLRPNESAFPTAKYWIGVRAEAATAALRAQLRLPEDQGVVVGEVMPDSPAQKAGLKRHDVILGLLPDVPDTNVDTAVAKSLSDPESLVKVVEEAGAAGKPLCLAVVSEGARKVTRVSPVDRPAGVPHGSAVAGAEPDAINWLDVDVDGAAPGTFVFGPAGAGNAVTLFAPRAVVTTEKSRSETKSSENLSINIEQKNDEPTRVTVRSGDETWTTTADRLDVLPERFRERVKAMLNHGTPAASGRIRFEPNVQFFEPGPTGKVVPPTVEAGAKAPKPVLAKPGKIAPEQLRERAEAVAREELARARMVHAKALAEARELQTRLERLEAERSKRQQADEPMSKEAESRLDRIEKSLAELVELQKGLVPALKALVEKEAKPAVPVAPASDKPTSD